MFCWFCCCLVLFLFCLVFVILGSGNYDYIFVISKSFTYFLDSDLEKDILYKQRLYFFSLCS